MVTGILPKHLATSRGPVDARLTFRWSVSVYASYLRDPFYTYQISSYGFTTKLSGSVRKNLLIVANCSVLANSPSYVIGSHDPSP